MGPGILDYKGCTQISWLFRKAKEKLIEVHWIFSFNLSAKWSWRWVPSIRSKHGWSGRAQTVDSVDNDRKVTWAKCRSDCQIHWWDEIIENHYVQNFRCMVGTTRNYDRDIWTAKNAKILGDKLFQVDSTIPIATRCVLIAYQNGMLSSANTFRHIGIDQAMQWW